MGFLSTPYNHLAFKSSHNSYESPYDLHELLATDFKDVSNFWCRGVEIDFARHSDGSGGRSASYFQVTHDKGGSGSPLASYLGYLLSWHLNNPDHDPIFVTLCIKSTDGDLTLFPDEFDTYISEWLTTGFLFKPSAILEQGDNLLNSVNRKGWPILGDLKGLMILCLSGTEDWKSYYSKTSPADRLCFADFLVPDNSPNPEVPADGTRIFANMNLFSDDWAKWQTAVATLRSAGYMVRGYVLDSETLWKKALAAKVNVLATDDVQGTGWATVGLQPPFAVLP